MVLFSLLRKVKKEMEIREHIVDFNEWCKKCKHKDESEFDENSDCYDCVGEPVNEHSRKPIYFEEQK